MQQISDVAYRREILGEEVPVSRKAGFSIFETHTDCISKGNREVVFGHKVNFASGKINLIFDCIQKRGNPSDIDYFPKLLANIKENFTFTPESIFKRGLKASVCNWEGWEKFKSFVLWNVITFNLRVIAKFLITKLQPA